MKDIVFIIIYFLGIIPAYFAFRHYLVRDGFKWTIGDRRFTIFISFASWLSVIVWLFFTLIDLTDNNKPAKW